METKVKTEEKKREEILLDTHNDEYWAKEFEVSPDDLAKKPNVDIYSLIVESGKKNKVFSL
ncbi:MAG: hypothetical protein JST19_12020 [Bacteroidetes bacterium]|nr:hypothetical protein [Bacteroidota bacterium]